MKSFAHFLTRLRAWLSQPRIIVQERVITTDETDRCEDPIFLIGIHRSGTSLMRRVFNSHPDIACPPETYFLKHYAAMMHDGDVEAGYRAFGFDADAMKSHLARLASDLHENYRRAQGKRRWADKTPQYVNCLPELAEMFGPRSRFVLIYRNPLDVAHSIDTRGWNVTGSDADYDFPETLDYLRQAYQAQNAFEALHPQRCCRLFYEDLVANPRDELTRILTFLGEEFSESMLNYHQQQHGFGTEDPIVRGSKGFNASHGNWVNWSDNRISAAKSELAAIAEGLGYSLDVAHAASGGR